DWLRGSTAGTGRFPPINIFQQGEDFVAIAERHRGLQCSGVHGLGAIDRLVPGRATLVADQASDRLHGVHGVDRIWVHMPKAHRAAGRTGPDIMALAPSELCSPA